MQKKRTTVILPKNASKEIREQMLRDGYSLRDKSKWFNEAIEDFLKIEKFYNLVEMAVLVDDLSQVETISLSEELYDNIEQAVIQVRQKYPALDGVRSLIVRASVIKRLVMLSKREVK